MYLPDRFANPDMKAARKLIAENPLATIITVVNHEPFISHLPLLAINQVGDNFALVGHMARANCHWQLMRKQPSTKIIFHGPNTYITPTWYAKNDVPTWNYAVVHIDGTVRLIEDPSNIENYICLLSNAMEQTFSSHWQFWIPDDLRDDKLADAIVGFDIAIDKLSAKFKLSQNRSKLDREGVIQGLATRKDEMSHQVKVLMLQMEHKIG